MPEIKEMYDLTKDEESYCKNCKQILSDISNNCIHCSHAPFVPSYPIGDFYVPKNRDD